MLGGPSAEREVSLRTGEAVARALRSVGHNVHELDPKTLGLGFARQHRRGVSRVARNVWRRRHGSEATGSTRRRLHGLRCRGEPHRVRQSSDEAALRESRRADGEICRRRFSRNAVAAWMEAACRGETSAPGIERRFAICGSGCGLAGARCAKRCVTTRSCSWKKKSKDGRRRSAFSRNEALPVVEVRPKQGSYDYRNKYTPGATEYFCPAPFDCEITDAHPNGRARCLSRHWRTRLRASGCDGARERRAGGARSEHFARHDGNEPVAQGGSGSGIELRGALSTHD